MIVQCNCLECSTRLEFESEHACTVISCPNCGHETKLYIPDGEPLNLPPPQNERGSEPRERGASQLASEKPAPPVGAAQSLGVPVVPGLPTSQPTGRSYFLFANDKQTGPFTLGEVKRMWVRGEITGSSLYARPGMSQWETLSSIQRELMHCALPAKEPDSPSHETAPTPTPGSALEAKKLAGASPAPEAAPPHLAMALRKCERCGRQLNDEDATCLGCGSPASPVQPPVTGVAHASEREPNPSRRKGVATIEKGAPDKPSPRDPPKSPPAVASAHNRVTGPVTIGGQTLEVPTRGRRAKTTIACAIIAALTLVSIAILQSGEGIAHIQFFLGKMYEKGKWVGKNPASAFEWYRRAAVRGYAPAQLALCFMYRGGEGVAVDEGEAIKWLRAAAHGENADAQVLPRCVVLLWFGNHERLQGSSQVVSKSCQSESPSSAAADC